MSAILDRISSYGNEQSRSPPAPILRLRLLGYMDVRDSRGRSLLPRSRKTRALLAILALSPRPVLRRHLTGLLWSRRQQEQARASLRQALHELQEVLSPDWTHLLAADRHHAAMRGAELWVDVKAVTTAGTARPDMLQLFRNVLLEDLAGLDPAFDNWLDEERQRLLRIARTIGEGIMAERRDHEGMVAAAEGLLAIDRTHEGAWRAVMRAHAERGDKAAAFAAYERCCAALAEARHLTPSADTDDLLVRIRESEIIVGVAQKAATAQGARRRMPRREAGYRRTGVRLGVVPWRTIGPGHDDALSVGLADEITTALSRFRWISCVSGSSWAALAGDGTLGGPDGDLDFVIDGTIQRSGRRIRVTARLLDMRAAGEVVWAGRFDSETADILSLQDEIGSAIVAQVDPELLMHEGERTAAQSPVATTPHELVLRAVPAIYRMDREGFHAAGGMLEKALKADPGNSTAHAWYAYWHLFLVGQGWADDLAAAASRAAELAERAVMLDPGDARAVTLAGHVRGFLGKHAAEASVLHDRAIALNPNLAIAWCFSGLAQSYMGNHDEARRRITKAIQLSPSDPHLFFFNMALIMPFLLKREYAAAAEAGRRAIELNRWFSSSFKGHLSALGHLGSRTEAAEVLEHLLKLEPHLTVRSAVARSPIGCPEDLACYAEGLRRAGLPEGH